MEVPHWLGILIAAAGAAANTTTHTIAHVPPWATVLIALASGLSVLYVKPTGTGE